jgi:uncharacterized protein (DUF1778 family)
MTAKNARIEIRADSDSQHRIAQAAALVKSSVSAFILGAANAEADRILARADHTLMPAEQFDALLASLDQPDEAPTLSRIATKPRRFTRK